MQAFSYTATLADIVLPAIMGTVFGLVGVIKAWTVRVVYVLVFNINTRYSYCSLLLVVSTDTTLASTNFYIIWILS